MMRERGEAFRTSPPLSDDEALAGWTATYGPLKALYNSDEANRVFLATAETLRDLLARGKLHAVNWKGVPLEPQHWEVKRSSFWHEGECAKGERQPKEAFRINEGELRQAVSSLFVGTATKLAKRPPGRKHIGDWGAHQQAYKAKVREEGIPSLDNEDGWQSQADVARYLQSLANHDDDMARKLKDQPKRVGDVISNSTATRRARKLMKEDGA